MIRRIAVVATLLLAGCSGAAPAADAPVYAEPPDPAAGGLLVIVGDQQRTDDSDGPLGTEHNDAERVRVAKEMAALAPDLLVVAGDLVYTGDRASDWARYDAFMEPVRSAGIPVLPALGNHDYDGDDEDALAHLSARFPQIGRSRWYRRRFGNLGLVWLDSNRKVFSDEEWAAQAAWFRDALDALEADDAVRSVIVFLHHPARTNSTRSSDSPPVNEAFVPPFLAARKTVAMVAGHVHAYEHFAEDGKHFVTSGGGGAPRPLLLEGAERRHEDLFTGAFPRPFHFLCVTSDDDALTVVVRALGDAETGTAEIDRFSVPHPSR
jgi:Icc-related predicted phosphoesterase